MLTIAQIKAELRAGSTTDLGGYPRYFLCTDGEALSFAAVRSNIREVFCTARRRDRHSGWGLLAAEVNWEDSDLCCAHTGERIPSAYAD